MWFVAIGCVLIAIKLAGVTAIAVWSWWWILSPFAAAAVWWVIADATGDTQRRAMDRERKRVEDRRERHLAAMGLDIFSGKNRKRRGSPPPNRKAP